MRHFFFFFFFFCLFAPFFLPFSLLGRRSSAASTVSSARNSRKPSSRTGTIAWLVLTCYRALQSTTTDKVAVVYTRG